MKFFEYPYVIITILVIIFLVMGLIGLYFTIKSVRTAKETAEKGFSGIGKIENNFEKMASNRKNYSVVYISVALDSILCGIETHCHGCMLCSNIFRNSGRLLYYKRTGNCLTFGR